MVVCKFDRAIGVCAVFICKKAQVHFHAWIGIIGAFLRRWRTVTIYAATVLFIAWAICWQACFTRTFWMSMPEEAKTEPRIQAVWRFLKDVVRERQGEWVK